MSLLDRSEFLIGGAASPRRSLQSVLMPRAAPIRDMLGSF